MICSKCKIEKPADEFSKNCTRKSGYGSECKQCVRERAKNNYKKNPEKYRAKAKEWKRNNPDLAKQIMKEWKIKNKERVASYDKQYRIGNEEVNRKARERMRKWAEKNPARHRASKLVSSHRRRALKEDCKTKLTSAEVNKLIEDSDNVCFWCDRYTEKIHLDHITPLSKGGEDKITNLVVSCPECNLRKGAKDPEVWLDEILNKEL